MRSSADHILTSHAGSLPRPDELIAANRAREAGDAHHKHIFQQKLCAAVGDVVRHQREMGIDVPGDGEFGKSMGQRVSYGAWRSYSFSRLGGLDFGAPNSYDSTPRRSRPGQVVLTNFAHRRDRALRRGLRRSRFRNVDGAPACGANLCRSVELYRARTRSRPILPTSRRL